MKVKCTEVVTRFHPQSQKIVYTYTFETIDISEGYMLATDFKIYSEQSLNHKAGKDYNLSID